MNSRTLLICTAFLEKGFHAVFRIVTPPFLIDVEKSGAKESGFKVLEEVSATNRVAGGYRFRPFGGGKRPEWFKNY